MFSSLFNADASFWRGFTRLMDVVGLSLCWLFCSIPLVTIPAASTALYDSVYHGIRRGEQGVYSRFFRTFLRELKTSLILLLAFLPFGALYLFSFTPAVTELAAGGGVVGAAVYAWRFLFCLPLAVWLFAMAMLSRFTFRALDLLRAATQMVFAHLPSAALVTAIALLAVRVMSWWYFSATFLPALAALLISFPMERLFKPFLEQKTEE